MRETVKIAIATMNSTPDFQSNMEEAKSMIKKAKDQDSDWVLLPEMFPVLGDSEAIKKVAKKQGLQILKELTSWAKTYEICIFAGSIPEYVDGKDKCYNTSYVISDRGVQLAKYRKIHLFELNDSSGQKIISEKDNYLAGDEICVFEIDGWRVGLAICYDLRFPGFFEKLAMNEDLDAIFLPAAFTKKTGQAHWEVLLRSRAIEQQCFLLAPNQLGAHNDIMESYGHSLVVNPWGEVLADSGETLGLITCRISKSDIVKAKAKVPSRRNRVF